MNNLRMVELNAGLHHDSNDALQRCVKTQFAEGGFMGFQRCRRILGAGHVDAADGAGFAAGNRNLGADDIGQMAFLFVGCRLFRGLAQASGTFGDDGRVQRYRIVSAGHGGIEMDFAEARGDVGFNQIDRFLHRFGGGFALPAVRPEMVAAKDDAL